MSGSISDILTTLKNGVIAMNTLSSYLKNGINLGRGALPASFFTYYTVAANTKIVLTNIDLCNTSGSSETVSVCLVPAGAVAGADNALIYDLPIPANSSFQWVGAQALGPNESIAAKASATAVVIHLTGAGG